jgi:hypothetical protein
MSGGAVPAAAFWLKLIVTPLLIAIATFVTRRWGPGVGGWLAGFPLTSAPVSVFLAFEQGPAFAAGAAVGTLLGLAAMGFSCLVYGRTARHTGWIGSTAATLVAFVAGLALVSRISFSLAGAFALVCATLVVAGLGLPTTSPGTPGVKPPAWDVPLRMIVATSVVLILTTAATHLGPTLSGLFSPIPVFLLVLSIFAQRAEGADASIRVMMGGIVGSFAFALFFLIVGFGLTRLGIGATYALASLSAIVVNGFALSLGRRFLR